MSIAKAWEDEFYIETLPPQKDAKGREIPWNKGGTLGARLSDGTFLKPGQVAHGGTRKPFGGVLRQWDAYAEGAYQEAVRKGQSMTRADALKSECQKHLSGMRRRLREMALTRWDLPDTCFTAPRLDRIWTFEARILDGEEFLALYDEDKAGPQETPKRNAYNAAGKRESQNYNWNFPRPEFWPADEVEAYRRELEEARWTLRALKMQHRLGMDPKAPKTIDGQTMARASLESAPQLDGGALKRGLSAILPKNWDKGQTAGGAR